MNALIERTLLALFLGISLAHCSPGPDTRANAPSKFPHMEAATIKEHCIESSRRFGRFASIAERLCEESATAVEADEPACFEECLQHCEAAAPHSMR